MVLKQFLKIFTVRSLLQGKWPREILHFNASEVHNIILLFAYFKHDLCMGCNRVTFTKFDENLFISS